MIKKILRISLLSSLIVFLNVSAVGAASPSEIKSQAYTYLGTPYLYGGTTTRGFDCSAFIQRVFSDIGIDLPRTTGQQNNVGTTVSKNNLEVGDLVFFNTTGKGVSHAGIYIGSSQFIHSSSSNGVSVSSINDPYYWGSKYIGAKRILAEEKAVVKEEVKAAAIDMSIYASRAEVAKNIADALNLTGTTTVKYSDVNATSEYYDVINAVTAANIFSGSNGKFNPSKPITRAQVAKVLVEAFDLQPGKGSYDFSDVKGNWASEYIQILAQNEITIGKPDGTFGVNDNVTITQMKTFMERVK